MNRAGRAAFFGLAVCGLLLAAAAPAACQSQAQRLLHRFDRNGDGRISRDEWTRRPGRFNQLDADHDGYVTQQELEAALGGRSGGAGGGARAGADAKRLDGLASRDAVSEETMCAIGRSRRCDIDLAVKRGLTETGLVPVFPAGAECRGVDERWAIDYSYKRDRRNYHGGIDIPAPFGTPIVAVAAGTVVGRFRGERGMRGMEVVLRHSPGETGLPVWIYTEYAHLNEMSPLKVGQRVRMGETVGLTGNSGNEPQSGKRGGGRERRPAIHFAVWFSTDPGFVALKRVIVPVKGYWMDPDALYRKMPPFDSYALKALPESGKRVAVSVMFADGSTEPAGTKLIWPYTCSRR